MRHDDCGAIGAEPAAIGLFGPGRNGHALLKPFDAVDCIQISAAQRHQGRIGLGRACIGWIGAQASE